MRGETPEWRQSYYVQNCQHSQLMREVGRLFPAWPQRALRTDRWKLILSQGGPTQLYDLENDPDELLNIFPVPRESVNGEYEHYESTDELVIELARQMLTHARSIDDALGIELATATIDDPHHSDNWVANGTPWPNLS